MSKSYIPSGDRRLNEIVAEYLRALEAGTEFNEELLIARHPEFAKQLRDFFADKQQIDELANVATSVPAADAGKGESDKTPVDAMAPTLPPTPVAARDKELNPPDSPLKKEGERVRYFGDYELLEEIARGGMGVVYKARQVNLNRIVALKMILAGQLASDEEVRRFYTEAEAAAGLDHPGIVPIYEVGQHEGQHYYSMGYVEGESLAHRLAEGPLPPKDAVELVKQVAEAVAFAHQHGVIHRDLKPSNVLLASVPPFSKGGSGRDCVESGMNPSSPPSRLPSALRLRLEESSRPKPLKMGGELRPRVTDFGLAKKLDVDSSLTGTGQILGTPSYMAPEQVKGDQSQIGPATDVYALGAILYSTLTGRPPFQGASPIETMNMVMHHAPLEPRKFNPAIDRDVQTIALKCLEKMPGDRYGSALELVEDASRYLNNDPIRARPPGPIRRLRHWTKTRPVIAAMTIGLAGLLLTIGSFVIAALTALTLISGTENFFGDRNTPLATFLLDDANQGATDWFEIRTPGIAELQLELKVETESWEIDEDNPESVNGHYNFPVNYVVRDSSSEIIAEGQSRIAWNSGFQMFRRNRFDEEKNVAVMTPVISIAQFSVEQPIRVKASVDIGPDRNHGARASAPKLNVFENVKDTSRTFRQSGILATGAVFCFVLGCGFMLGAIIIYTRKYRKELA